MLMAQIRSRDIWELAGPRTLMSDLEQPAHESADSIETSDEDNTAVEEPDAEIDSWGAEFAMGSQGGLRTHALVTHLA